MKKIFNNALLAMSLCFPLLGEDCSVKEVEIAIPIATDIPFQINSTNAVYSDVETVSFKGKVEQAIIDAGYNLSQVIEVKIESVVYTITQNSSAPNTNLNGALRVGPENLNNPQSASSLAQLANVNLNAIANQEQRPALNSAGVTFLNTKLMNAIVLNNDSGIFKAFLDGQVSPAPPPNLAFQLAAKVSFTILVVEEVELPNGCSNPLDGL